jgi:hypothetical protein
VSFRPFHQNDLQAIRLQPAQSTFVFSVQMPTEGAVTAIDASGRVLGCGGIVTLRDGVGCGWALLAIDLRGAFVAIHRAALRALAACPLRRVEAYVACDFAEGHLWARMLGFNREARRMRAFLPNGQDASLYARVR